MDSYFIVCGYSGNIYRTCILRICFILDWNYNDPELAVAGTILHGFEFLFVRLAPIVFWTSVVGIVVTYKKDKFQLAGLFAMPTDSQAGTCSLLRRSPYASELEYVCL